MKYRKSQTWQMLLYSLVMRVRKNSHQGILLRTWILGKHIGGHSHCRDTEAPGLPCGKSHLHPRPFSGGLQHTFSWSQLPHLEPAGRYCFALTQNAYQKMMGIGPFCSWPHQVLSQTLSDSPVSPLGQFMQPSSPGKCQYPALKSDTFPLLFISFSFFTGVLIGIFLHFLF